MSEIKDHSATCPTCGRYLTVLGCTAERCAGPAEEATVIDSRPALLEHERQRGRAVADVSIRQLSPEEQAGADALHEKLWGRRPREANVSDQKKDDDYPGRRGPPWRAVLDPDTKYTNTKRFFIELSNGSPGYGTPVVWSDNCGCSGRSVRTDARTAAFIASAPTLRDQRDRAVALLRDLLPEHPLDEPQSPETWERVRAFLAEVDVS